MKNILLLLLVMSTGVSLMVISKHYEPVLQPKTYKVISNYQKGTRLNFRIWARNIKNTQTGKVFVENNILLEDTVNFPSGSEMYYSLSEDQPFAKKMQYVGSKIVQIFGIIFIGLAVLSFFGFLRNYKYKNSKKQKNLLKKMDIKSRTSNPAYSVKPINTVEGIKKHFDRMYGWITVGHCPLKPVADESKIVELIKLTPGLSTEASLKEIDKLGFEPAPSNYLLGLGVQHPDAHREHKYIVSLDKQNLFANEYGYPCFLCLGWGSKRYLDVAIEASGWDGDWWFAVVRKQPLKS